MFLLIEATLYVRFAMDPMFLYTCALMASRVFSSTAVNAQFNSIIGGLIPTIFWSGC